jgi:hypothetical protein
LTKRMRPSQVRSEGGKWEPAPTRKSLRLEEDSDKRAE